MTHPPGARGRRVRFWIPVLVAVAIFVIAVVVSSGIGGSKKLEFPGYYPTSTTHP